MTAAKASLALTISRERTGAVAGTPAAGLLADRTLSPPLASPLAHPSGPIRVSILCPAALLRQRLQEMVRTATDMRVLEAESGGRADVVLCAAESGGGLRLLGESLAMTPEPARVLLDTAGLLGPFGAGLHRFRGYCPPDVGEERLLRCVRRVAKGEIDAPRPHLETLIRVLEAPPLDERDLRILRLLALGRSNHQMVIEVPIKERTLEARLHRLADWFDAADRCHLAAIVVALNAAWPFEDDPADGSLMLKRTG